MVSFPGPGTTKFVAMYWSPYACLPGAHVVVLVPASSLSGARVTQRQSLRMLCFQSSRFITRVASAQGETPADDDGLFPARHQPGDVGCHNGFPEHRACIQQHWQSRHWTRFLSSGPAGTGTGSLAVHASAGHCMTKVHRWHMVPGKRIITVQDVSDGAIGRLPHLFEVELLHARLIRRDGGALDAHAHPLVRTQVRVQLERQPTPDNPHGRMQVHRVLWAYAASTSSAAACQHS